MTSDALRPLARNRNRYSVPGFISLATLLLCLSWLTACSAATASNSAKAKSPQLSGNLSSANVGVPYNGTISVSGGKAPYVFSLSSGALPSGLTLSQATGTISGTPGQSGVFNFAVQATDSKGMQAAQSFQIPVSSSGVVAVTVTPAIIAVGSSGTQQLTAQVTNTSNVAVT